MKRVIFFLICLFALRCEALTLLDENGNLIPPFAELLQLCELPTDCSLEELALILRAAWIQEGKERWQYEERFNDKKIKALPLLEAIGCLDAIHAQKFHYNYVLVLGALASRVEKRLNFLWEEWKRGVRFDAIFFLTGQRDIEKKMEILPIGITSETQMMIYLYRSHPLSEAARGVPLAIIDTSKQCDAHGLLKRPNTADTVKAWLQTRPAAGSCLAISDQPFVGYQEAVLKKLLPADFFIEVIGMADERKFPLILYLDNLAKWLLHSHD